jgi:glycosyltransferase involved in cell wall biosynthesis
VPPSGAAETSTGRRASRDAPGRPLRIFFLVRSLDLGGAERQLVALARGLHGRGHDVAVAVFYAGGRFEPELRASGVDVHDLGKRGRWETLGFLRRLAERVGAFRPDVLHAYMEANVFAALAKPLFPPVKIVWGIRSAKSDFRHYDPVARFYPWFERALAAIPDAAIVNSMAARRQAIANGLAPRKVLVVPNGIDCAAFAPDPAGRARLRARWGVGDRELVVGMVARLDPVKNHANFVRAAARVAATRRDVRFVCVGDRGSRPGYRASLERLAAGLHVAGRLVWADEGKVSSAVYSAFDLAVLSSDVGESFPNVLGEAMACGRPVVTTDSGDAALIVGDPRAVARPRDDVALARCILSALDGIAPGAAFAGLRARIQAEYSLDLLAARTERALEAVRTGRATGAGDAAAAAVTAGRAEGACRPSTGTSRDR